MLCRSPTTGRRIKRPRNRKAERETRQTDRKEHVSEAEEAR